MVFCDRNAPIQVIHLNSVCQADLREALLVEIGSLL